MMRVRELIILLLLSGSVLVCDLQPHGVITRFHHVNLMKNWTEAQSYCRENFIDLATIPSQAANTEAQQEVAGHDQVWIGLYNGSWKWSQEGKQVESLVLNLISGDPGTRKCAVLSWTRRWSAKSCSAKHRFMCYTADNKHVLVKQQMNWSDAQTFCRKNYVDLSSIMTYQDLNDMYRQLVSSINRDDNNAWIGLYRDTWVWSDGGNDTYRQWKNLPYWSWDCVVMATSSGTWTIRPCQERRSFFCYSVVKPSGMSLVKVRLIEGSADPTDPMVQESILQQLRQQLLDRGITEHVKLRWKRQPDGEVFHREEETAPPADHQDVCKTV